MTRFCCKEAVNCKHCLPPIQDATTTGCRAPLVTKLLPLPDKSPQLETVPPATVNGDSGPTHTRSDEIVSGLNVQAGLGTDHVDEAKHVDDCVWSTPDKAKPGLHVTVTTVPVTPVENDATPLMFPLVIVRVGHGLGAQNGDAVQVLLVWQVAVAEPAIVYPFC